MVNLEEQYYKYRKDVASLWESLLQCNESISLSLENALKEHDQNISARTFPPSLLPNGSHFPSGRQRT
ncbi:hypothetical protein F5I97DRAFT_1801861 [Phlebopus sp. FC_14]|nr:hypothetical protein F5I97DRAFT_1801861 [Phlebopus sp. FC_14]